MTVRFAPVGQYVFFGGGSLLVAVAERLRGIGHPIAVVTSPRHAGEHVRPDVRLDSYLERAGFPCVVVDRLDGRDVAAVRDVDHSVGVSFGAAWIFSRSFIDSWQGRLLNVHGARLPQDRGSGGFSWQILRGGRLGYCAIHVVDTGIDTGPLLKLDEFVYPASCRIPADYQRVYLEKNVEFVAGFLKDAVEGAEFTAMPQPEHLSTFWPRLSTEHHGFIDWSWHFTEVERFICAFDEPYRGASTFLNGKRVFLKSAWSTDVDGVFHPFQSGLVYRKTPARLFVSGVAGSLIVHSVSDEAHKDVTASIRLGDRFWTPASVLDEARQLRATYDAHGLTKDVMRPQA